MTPETTEKKSESKTDQRTWVQLDQIGQKSQPFTLKMLKTSTRKTQQEEFNSPFSDSTKAW